MMRMRSLMKFEVMCDDGASLWPPATPNHQRTREIFPPPPTRRIEKSRAEAWPLRPGVQLQTRTFVLRGLRCEACEQLQR